MDEATQSIGKYVVGGFFSAELYGIVFDLRWVVGLLAMLMIADFWFGCRESKMRRIKIRKSRCIRRTMNKGGDYFMYLIVGFVLGGAIFEPLHWCTPSGGAAAGLLVACIAESDSIFDHWLKLHGLRWSWKKFFIALIRLKWSDALGTALEKGCETEKEEK